MKSYWVMALMMWPWHFLATPWLLTLQARLLSFQRHQKTFERRGEAETLGGFAIATAQEAPAAKKRARSRRSSLAAEGPRGCWGC